MLCAGPVSPVFRLPANVRYVKEMQLAWAQNPRSPMDTEPKGTEPDFHRQMQSGHDFFFGVAQTAPRLA